MSQSVILQGSDGPVSVPMLGETKVGNNSYVVVDLGVGLHYRGVFIKHALVSTSQILNKNIEDIRE